MADTRVEDAQGRVLSPPADPELTAADSSHDQDQVSRRGSASSNGSVSVPNSAATQRSRSPSGASGRFSRSVDDVIHLFISLCKFCVGVCAGLFYEK